VTSVAIAAVVGLWSYTLPLGTTPQQRIASVSLTRSAVIVETASGIRALDLANGRVRWSRDDASLPADAARDLVVATTSHGIVAFDSHGALRWRSAPCAAASRPLAIATNGDATIVLCPAEPFEEGLVDVVLVDRQGRRQSSRREGAFEQGVRFFALRKGDDRVVFEQVFEGAAMEWVTTELEISSARTIEPSHESFIAYRNRLFGEASALGVVCRAAPMTNFLRNGVFAVGACGGDGDPLTINANRVSR